LRWFKAYIENINDEDEKAGDVKTRLELPVLLITANKDIVASAQIMEAGIRQFADDVRVEEVNTGHWVHLEAKNEVNAYLEAFFTDLQVGID
jgi:pimeloyl-ACP methyl ester carboxylesterase